MKKPPQLIALALVTAILSLSAHGDAQQKPMKYILTGGPGSGKTSTVLALEKLYGEHIIFEAATDHILVKQAQGHPEPWKLENFDSDILALQLQREERANNQNVKRIFSDRSPIYILAYNKTNDPQLYAEAQRVANDPSYSKIVFLIENLGHCHNTKVRREPQDEALRLERLQAENYSKLGFTIVRVPPGTLEARAQQILDRVALEEGKTVVIKMTP